MAKSLSLLLIAILLGSLDASSAFAATITWTNTSGGNWSVAANWSPNQVPGAADTAQITTSGTYSVTNNSSVSVSVLTLGGATGIQTLILSLGALTLGSASAGNAQAVVNITGGTLGGPGSLTLAGPLNWSAGNLTNLVQFNGGTFSGNFNLNGGQIINVGTLNWTAASMNTGNGSLISNAPAGIINMTANLNEGGFGGIRNFNNAGQFNVSISGTANIGDTFNNTGSVAINGGTLNLGGGGSGSGSFSAVSGATLAFSGSAYTISNSATISGAGNFTVATGAAFTTGAALNLGGTWTFSGGTATLSGSTTVNGNAVIVSGCTVNLVGTGPWQPGTLTISGGTLEGTTPVTVLNAGGMTWSGGNLYTNLVQFNGGTFSNNSLTLNYGGKVINTGVLNWSAASMNTGNGSLISNAPAGIINMTTNLSEGSYGGIRNFNNAGQLNVSISGTATIGDTFNNTGSVAINGGTLNLGGGGIGSGSFSAVSGATLAFSGSAYTISNSATISGAGNFTVAAGATFTTGAELNLGGTWTFSGGTATLSGPTTVSGNAVIVSGCTVNLVGTGPWQPGTLTISGGTLEGTTPVTVLNSGGMTWSGGNLYTNLVQFNGGTFSNNNLTLNYGGKVINTGVLNWSAASMNTGNGSLISNAPAGIINMTTNLSEGSFAGIRNFNNAGQLNVSISGTATIGDTFNNTGTVTFNVGVLNLSGARNLAGGTFSFGINGLSNYGSNILAGAADLAGTLKSVFNSGYLPSVGNTYNIMTYGSSSGSFTATNLSPLAVWQVNQNSTALSITVLKLVPQMAWSAPADIVYGTPLAGTQLNATASWNGTNVPGVFNYNPSSGIVLNSGSNQMLSVTFVPSDPATFTNVTTTVLINVQKAPLTVTATNLTKFYGQTLSFSGTEITTAGLVNGDIVTSASLASAGAAPTANVAGSPYTITITNAAGVAGLTNYVITYAYGELTVNRASLGITANNRGKAYGQTITFAGTEFTPTGLQNSETVGSVTLASTGASATASVAGSPYSIVPSAAAGGTFDPNNYSINYANGALTVVKALLMITADDTNKIAGESLSFSGTEFAAAGLQNSETVGTVTLASTGASAGAGVGAYPIVPSAPTGGTFSQGNYTNSFANGTLTVLSPTSLTLSPAGLQTRLTFQALSGQSYQVQTATNLTTSTWTPLGGAISGTNGTVNVTNNIGAPQTFFRLQIQLAP